MFLKEENHRHERRVGSSKTRFWELSSGREDGKYANILGRFFYQK